MKKLFYFTFVLLVSGAIVVSSCSEQTQAKVDDSVAETEDIAEKIAAKSQEKSTEAFSQKNHTTPENLPEDAIQLTWNMLKDVSFEEKYYEKIQQYLLYPTFGQSLKDLEGKTVYITGYVIPVEAERYVLSANPFASCFFCGNAGPETIVELELTSYDEMYYTDEWRTFQGRFQLNAEDIDKLNYLLVAAEPVED